MTWRHLKNIGDGHGEATVEWYLVPAHTRSVPTGEGLKRVSWPTLAFGVVVDEDLRPRQLAVTVLVSQDATAIDETTRVFCYDSAVCLGELAEEMINEGRLHPIDAYFSTTFHDFDTALLVCANRMTKGLLVPHDTLQTVSDDLLCDNWGLSF